MQENSTFYQKKLTENIENEEVKTERLKEPKLSVINSLLNYSKSLEFKKSNYVNQFELVFN